MTEKAKAVETSREAFEQLLDEAVTQWVDGPGTIEDFCEWLIVRSREGWQARLNPEAIPTATDYLWRYLSELPEKWKVFHDALPDGEYKGIGELRLLLRIIQTHAEAAIQANPTPSAVPERECTCRFLNIGCELHDHPSLGRPQTDLASREVRETVATERAGGPIHSKLTPSAISEQQLRLAHHLLHDHLELINADSCPLCEDKEPKNGTT